MTSAVGHKISVCVLTYNHVGIVASTIESALEQSIGDYELLVSDDGSTDGTWEAVLRLASEHPNVRAVQTPRNLGMAGNANFAVAQTTRPFIALLHHDDVYRRDLLEKWGQTMERFDDVGFVFNPYALHESDYVWRDRVPAGRVDGRWLLDTYLLPRWGCLVRGTAMIRRSAWDAVGGMREEFGMLADIDLWMRLARRGAVGYVDEPLIAVRHARPSYYPTSYQAGSWSWKRQRLVYEIHAKNRLETLDRHTVAGELAWRWFQARLGLETTKWLAYAVVRRKPEMIRSASEGRTAHDPLPVSALRWLLQRGVELVPNGKRAAS